MSDKLPEKLLKQPLPTIIDLISLREMLKTGAEILREKRDQELERVIAELGLVFEWRDGKYLVARSSMDLGSSGIDPVSRGRWFGIPECCIQAYIKRGKEEARKTITLEEMRILREGGSIPDEFYFGSIGYVPCSINCEATLKRGQKLRAALEKVSPQLIVRFRDLHIRPRIVRYGGEV
ncbi:MAG: hypothetical protein APU95_00890 [Hadesarchaea archaeon YNP_N21]|jgi:hypothetical protein|nr:MAG: hypothetical protein APU95_00890 [Hadesarchaea archaeon YNP_N21]